jgi:hypothetical protein
MEIYVVIKATIQLASLKFIKSSATYVLGVTVFYVLLINTIF